MKFENIVKQLTKDGYNVEPMEFSFQECKGVCGTALVDLVNGSVVSTSAKYREVVQQIAEGKSHIYTHECGKKRLSEYKKYQN